MQRHLKDFSITELKALIYDLNTDINRCEQTVKAIETVLSTKTPIANPLDTNELTVSDEKE